MTQEADYYTAHEAARLLGLSPARVRQMLRAGELEGERGPERMEGVPGPWRIPSSAVSAYREAREALEAADAAETVALPRQEEEEFAPTRPPDAPRVWPEDQPPEEAPSESTERLSEGVGALRDKIEEIIEELDLLESRLEAAEVEHIAVREAASREKERAEKLQAALEAERAGRRGSGLTPGGEDCSGAEPSELPSAYPAGRCQLLRTPLGRSSPRPQSRHAGLVAASFGRPHSSYVEIDRTSVSLVHKKRRCMGPDTGIETPRCTLEG